MEAVLTQVLAFLQGTLGKSAVIYGFGWLFKLNPKFKDAGIPLATLVVNIVLTLLSAAAEAVGGGVSPAGFVLAAVDPTAGGANVILDILIPQVIADGAYNWPRKIWAWLQSRIKR